MPVVQSMILMLAVLCAGGCQPGSQIPAAGSIPAASPESGATASVAGRAAGRITMPDGSPLSGDIRDITVVISGVSEAGEKVSYTPAVKNGAYDQKLVPGQYRFDRGTITVGFQDQPYTFDLVPVGTNWSKNQDAADGISQDFVWKPTGVAETYGAKPDPNNATHWHGLNIGMRFSIYRSDINQSSVAPPEGTRLVFTLKPTSTSIDGRELEPITVEREWRPKDVTPNDDLNDLPIANYEITGVAHGPDGSVKPILLQGPGDYPAYHDKGTITVGMDNILGGIWKPPFGWVIE